MVAAMESAVTNDISPLKKYAVQERTRTDEKDTNRSASCTSSSTSSSSSSSSASTSGKSKWQQKWQHIVNNITVEPIVAAYIMPSVLSNLATQNLNLEKACRVNMQYGDEVCDSLTRRDTSNYTLEEETIQKMVAHMVAWKTVIQSLFPCLLILFWGSWSDRHHRRKPCILIPIVGEFLATVGLMLCVYLKDTPMEAAGLTEAIFPALSGGWFVMLMGVFSYIADITTEEERTLRIGILNVCFSVGVPVGTALSGVLLKKIGFYGVFTISASFYVIALIYGCFLLPEPRQRPETPSTMDIKKPFTKQKSLLCDFFDKAHIMETFRVAFRKGAHRRRERVILLMIVVMVVIGPLYGEMNVTYLFTRYRFNWSEVEFSVFSTFAVVTGLFGVMFCVGILSHKLKFEDATIGVISSTSKILSGFVYAFAIQPWHMYVGAIVEIFNGTSFIAMRSMATKLVSKDELGKVNSLFGVAEALMPVVYAPMYSTLYAATIKVFPGAFYVLGSAITVLAVLIFLWMYNFQRQFDRAQAKLQQEQKDQQEKEAKGLGSGLVVGKEANGNLTSTLESIVLTNDSTKGHSNGILTQIIVRPEINCDLNNGQIKGLRRSGSAKQGFENQAFQTDEPTSADNNSNTIICNKNTTLSSNNTHL